MVFSSPEASALSAVASPLSAAVLSLAELSPAAAQCIDHDGRRADAVRIIIAAHQYLFLIVTCLAQTFHHLCHSFCLPWIRHRRLREQCGDLIVAAAAASDDPRTEPGEPKTHHQLIFPFDIEPFFHHNRLSFLSVFLCHAITVSDRV